jgi:hypothetical protein
VWPRTGIGILDKVPDRDARATRARAAISRQVRHLAGLVDDLLGVAHATTGKTMLNRS